MLKGKEYCLIEDLDYLYKIDVEGNMFSLKGNEKKLKPFIKNGYKAIRIQHNNKFYNYYIHRLLAFYWVGGYELNLEVNHKDGNKLNNKITNLEWVTRSQNTKHAWDNGLISRSKSHRN
jgi:hypothetical protein